MNRHLAVQFIQAHASPLELARLEYLQSGQPAGSSVVAAFQAAQHKDGGFSPFWATEYSSLDATCFQLSKAQQLGISFDDAVIVAALRFLAQRQKSEGSWEEDVSIAAQAPPWAKPGEMPALLYLTANCCNWLAGCDEYRTEAIKAGDFLIAHQEKDGHLASFLHTHWLAAGAWLQLDMLKPATLALDYIITRFEELAASHLAWLVTTLLPAGLPVSHALIVRSLAKLEDLQQPDGHWQSEDGADFDVNATLEGLFAFKLRSH